MKSLILFLTIFLCTLSLNTIVLGQGQDDSNCPFALFHIIKEERGWNGSEAVANLLHLLQYGVDLNPNLEDECFDPYYTSLPKGTTLLHVLMYSSIGEDGNIFNSFESTKKSLYREFVKHGADPYAVDENGKTASDLWCWPVFVYQKGNSYCMYGYPHGTRRKVGGRSKSGRSGWGGVGR